MILGVTNAIFAIAHRSIKICRTSTRFEPVTSRYRCDALINWQPRSQGLSSLPPLVVGTETLVAAGHVTIYPFKTAGWVGTQVHLVERTIKYPTLPADFSTTQILGGHVSSCNQVPSLFQRLREAENRDPGNEVDQLSYEATDVGGCSFMDSNEPGETMKLYMKYIIYGAADEIIYVII